jgi:hypothetical protein
MVNFAFCYENEDELNFVRNEIEKCFKIREINIAIMAYRNAYEFLRCISCNCPDVLFYDLEGCDGLIHEAALAAKKTNKKLISIITRNECGDAYEDEFLLEPFYTLPSLTREHLWMYASLAYDAFLDDYDTFTYYTRPNCIHIPIKDVIYFASEGRRTHIVSHRHRDSFYQKLDEIELLIAHKRWHFIRIHKSYLVNPLFISSYNRDYVTLLNGDKLRISKYNYYMILKNDIKSRGLPIKKNANYY